MIDARDVLVVVGRPTFDLDSAAPLIERARRVVDPTTLMAADGDILRSPEEVAAAVAPLPDQIRRLVVLFASFSDSRLVMSAVERFSTIDNVILWSLPEEWTGERLRRNSLCGANLAAYRLRSEGWAIAAIHEYPSPALGRSLERAINEVDGASARSLWSVPPRPALTSGEAALVRRAVEGIRRPRLGIIGGPPPGFEPCESDEARPRTAAADVSVERWFEAAHAASTDATAVTALGTLDGGDVIDREDLDRSVALRQGAELLARAGGWDALAIRCWPECFDDWGGAACAAMAMLNEDGLPAACEADALGAISMQLMQTLSGAPTFLADLVDVDLDEDQLAFWHCGVAPRTFAASPGEVRVDVHANRGVPLVFDFALADGPITIARISHGPDGRRLVVGEGRLNGTQPFRGTSGVVQLPSSARSAVATIMGEGIEHHLVVAVGHHRRLLEAVAADLDLPVVSLN